MSTFNNTTMTDNSTMTDSSIITDNPIITLKNSLQQSIDAGFIYEKDVHDLRDMLDRI